MELGRLEASDEALFAGQTDARAITMRRVVEGRTRHITFLLDDVHGVHNLAAVVRSCDAWGIADLHCILSDDEEMVKNRKQKMVDPGDILKDQSRFHRGANSLADLFEKESTKRVSKGTDKWLSIEEYSDSSEAVRSLKKRGYKICVSSLSPNALPLGEVDLTEKICFVFGNEHSGVSKPVEELADVQFTIPMYGFVESCNISVAAATVASHVVERARTLQHGNFLRDKYFLQHSEQRALYHKFLIPKVPSKRQSSHEKLRSRYDVTRLGAHVERRGAREGLFVDAPKSWSSLSDLLQESLRFSDTGALVRRYFVRRVKIGAMGDSGPDGYAKRSKSILDGVVGIAALSCEAAIAGMHCSSMDEHLGEPIFFGQRHRLVDLFRKAAEAVNNDYSFLFDASGYPAFPPFSRETEHLFTETRDKCYLRAWEAANEYFLSDTDGDDSWSAADVARILERVGISDIVQVLVGTIRSSSEGAEALKNVSKSCTEDNVSGMTKLVANREPGRDSFTSRSYCRRNRPKGPEETGLSDRELAVVHILVRLAQCVNVVSLVHQCVWEKETGNGSRLIQSTRFGLLEMLLVDATADMKLLKAAGEMKETRCVFEIMCLVDRMCEAAAHSMT